MFIRYFVDARSNNEAIGVVEATIDELMECISLKRLKSVIPYWKMENIYIVEMDIEIKKDNSKDFLDYYSDRWIKFGSDNFLSSKSDPECTYMRKGFEMIDIALMSDA